MQQRRAQARIHLAQGNDLVGELVEREAEQQVRAARLEADADEWASPAGSRVSGRVSWPETRKSCWRSALPSAPRREKGSPRWATRVDPAVGNHRLRRGGAGGAPEEPDGVNQAAERRR